MPCQRTYIATSLPLPFTLRHIHVPTIPPSHDRTPRALAFDLATDTLPALQTRRARASRANDEPRRLVWRAPAQQLSSLQLQQASTAATTASNAEHAHQRRPLRLPPAATRTELWLPIARASARRIRLLEPASALSVARRLELRLQSPRRYALQYEL